MIAFVTSTYYVALGKLAEQYVDKDKLKKVSQRLQAVIEENTETAATDYMPVIKYVVDELKPNVTRNAKPDVAPTVAPDCPYSPINGTQQQPKSDPEQTINGWVWIGIGIRGALAVFLVFLAVKWIMFHNKRSNKDMKPSVDGSSIRAEASTKPLPTESLDRAPQSDAGAEGVDWTVASG